MFDFDLDDDEALVSDEREISDDLSRFDTRDAHSKRSRQIAYEKEHGWDSDYKPHRDGSTWS